MQRMTPQELIELSQTTGRSLSELKALVERNGVVVSDQPERPKNALSNPADAVALMRQIKTDTIARLYKDDVLIRESLDAQYAIEQASSHFNEAKQDNNIYDDSGNFKGTNKSIINGSQATVKNQTEAMKAIKADIYKRYGFTENQ
jgi:organic radical activating enzyme